MFRIRASLGRHKGPKFRARGPFAQQRARFFRGGPLAFPTVNKLCIFVGTTLGSLIGGFLGDQFGFMAAFILSGIGSIAGVYFGWKLAQKLDR